MKKCHRFDRDGNHTRLRQLAGENCATQIHLRNEPAAENIAIAICVLGHRDRLDHELALRLIGHTAENTQTLPLPLPLRFLVEKVKRKQKRTGSNNQHAIAVAVETVTLPDRFAISAPHKLASGEGAHQHEKRRTREMKIRQERIDDAKLERRINE